CLLPGGARLRVALLVEPYAVRRESSLSYMASRVQAFFGRGSAIQGFRGGRFRPRSFRDALASACRRGGGMLLFGTTLALWDFLGFLKKEGTPLKLGVASRVMETGGAKTRKSEVPRGELLNLVKIFL
ncbi:MAG: hypothetical protein HQL11_04330, partial [Candidatus Omnitrophica bacterium]|nr:hypothetical protein [Candidatus Omnitrophota bacterium]